MKDTVKIETIEDVLTFLASNSYNPKLDRLYTYHRFNAIISGELTFIYNAVFRNRVLQDQGGKVIKGAKQESPGFHIRENYGIE